MSDTNKKKTSIFKWLYISASIVTAATIVTIFVIIFLYTYVVGVGGEKVETILEMEVSINEAFQNLLDYEVTNDTRHKELFQESVSEFAIFKNRFQEIANTDQEFYILNNIELLRDTFYINASTFIDLHDRQVGQLESRAALLERQIDELLDNKLQPLAGSKDTREQLLEIEINIKEFSSAIGFYLIDGEESLTQIAVDSVEDYLRWRDVYLLEEITEEEKLLFTELDAKVQEYFDIGNDVTNIRRQKVRSVTSVEDVLSSIEELFDEHLDSIEIERQQLIKKRLFYLISFTLFLLFCSYLFFWKVILNVRGYMTILKTKVAAVENGSMDDRIPVISDDAIGTLVQSYNALLARLMRCMGEEGEDAVIRVKELTHELHELKSKYAEVERMNNIMVKRETQMAELKKRINELEEERNKYIDDV